MDIRLIVLDLDGTALNSRGILEERTKDALARRPPPAQQLPQPPGRALSALPREIRKIPSLEYAITSNGSGIYRLADGTRIYSNPMTADNLHRLLALLADYPCPMEAFIDGIAYADRRYVEDPLSFRIPPRSAEYVRATRTPCGDMVSLIRRNCHRIEGMDIIVTDMELKKKIRSLAERIPNLYVTSSVPHYLEFAYGTATKKTALAFLISRLGLSPGQVMACGDGENDLEMLAFAGLGVAMAMPPIISSRQPITSRTPTMPSE